MSGVSSSLGDVLASMQLDRVGAASFEGKQLPAPANHILGGHISAQALLAASLTAPGRTPHSVHTYFLRPGDSRHVVTFEVTDLQEGRTFSARRVTARQGDEILLEAMSSFKTDTTSPEPVTYQPPCPDVAPPESLPEVAPHFAESDTVTKGQWASLRWFERRIVDAETAPPARSRIWWRPGGPVPADPVLTASLVAYLSAVTLTEPAYAARGGVSVSAQRDHSVWFHAAADLSDWLLYEQSSPSSADTLALASGTMFNRTGELVCTVRQEMYFPPPRR
ncbi:acyl-CoA thioesterase [Mycolicibacterium aurum]|uniref:Acyl-CoA thioesterase n=1 Tax=Mycolicibacterium aurum TaxID=1791 RepID=A0A448J149_MYCAU|nr:acyl-CoA thioesterase [Mycolicibacterium aurum]